MKKDSIPPKGDFCMNHSFFVKEKRIVPQNAWVRTRKRSDWKILNQWMTFRVYVHEFPSKEAEKIE